MARGDRQTVGHLTTLAICAIAMISAARAEERTGSAVLAPWSAWLAAGLIAAVAATVVLTVLYVLQWRSLAGARREAHAVEHAFGELIGAGGVKLSELPGQLVTVKADVELLLARLDALSEAPPIQRRPDQTLLDAAVAAVEAAIDAAATMPQSADSAIVDRFDIVNQLTATTKTLTLVRDADDQAATLANALRTGQLNHLLTVAPLLEVYFRDDRACVPLRVNYATASAAIDCLLAHAGIVTEVVPPLSFVPYDRQGQLSPHDKRRLGEISSVRDQVRSRARKLEDTDLLIIDCLAPGWRHADVRQPPTLIAYNRANWIS